VSGRTLLAGFFREPELARELNKHPRTLKRWRDLGIGPPFAMLGSEIIYPIPETRAWLSAGGTAHVGSEKKRWATARARKGDAG
jgi:hypothetical protein